jgi:UDP-2,3-diacylglucosamine pyrophosphatase LpxH
MAVAVESLIVLSDVHLGSDLVAHGPTSRRRSREIDEDLVRLVDHYRAEAPQRGRWRLVIAGDLIDFIGISLPADQEGLETEPSAEERKHGLGSANDHAVAKMRAVADRHREIFDAFARFVADGNALTIIHGNHDLELHWEDVRAELTRALVAGALAHDPALDEAAFLERVEFSPWFFYRDGVAYIEHGHQYDAYCATEHLLAPLSPLDPRRVARGFCDVLLRFVVRQTPGLSESGHESLGIVDYLRFGTRLGIRGMVALGVRFALAIRELFRLRREHLHEATRRLRVQHLLALRRFARARKLGVTKVRALLKLQVPPVTNTISGIMGSLLLDRLALATSCIAVLGLLALLAIFEPRALLGVLAVIPIWILGHRYFAKRRKIDPVEELASRAREIASLFRAPFVVMGHTHVLAREPLEGATYINVGFWAEEEGDRERAPRTHLVIHPEGDGAVAHFLRWDRSTGPTEIEVAG